MEKKKHSENILRDQFAISAISGLALHDLTHPEKVVARAWKLADLMILARDREAENGNRHSDALR